jgi:hypothetical protein
MFFKWDPCASRIFHRPSFLACMQLPPSHCDFPHSALLHAIVKRLPLSILNTSSLTACSAHPHLVGHQRVLLYLKQVHAEIDLLNFMPAKQDSILIEPWLVAGTSFKLCKLASYCPGTYIKRVVGWKYGSTRGFRQGLPYLCD